jgi:hypothetical protein
MNKYVDEKEIVGNLNEKEKHGEYYKSSKGKSYLGIIIFLWVLFLIAVLTLWYRGYFSPPDKEAEYRILSDTICESALEFVSDEENRTKWNSKELNVPGEVLYITLQDLVDAFLVETKIVDPRTHQRIPLSTDIRLAVIAEDIIMCEGFAWYEDDRVPPIIYLVGNEEIYLKKGTVFVDPGYYAIDYRDGELTKEVVRSGHVDINKQGNYYLYYNVSDRAGNQASQVKRTIIVQ